MNHMEKTSLLYRIQVARDTLHAVQVAHDALVDADRAVKRATAIIATVLIVVFTALAWIEAGPVFALAVALGGVLVVLVTNILVSASMKER